MEEEDKADLLTSQGSRWAESNRDACTIPTYTFISTPFDEDLLVKNLILYSGYWNSVLINQRFLPIDVAAILSVSLGLSNAPDKLFWHYENSGEYSVKSGYQTTLYASLEASDSSSGKLRKW
ncbi:hypothetical protein TorRG33x02_309390 [Trema orientale]|uniref:Uncharacterized protein n=1 Tax=Trema orientale TaxID=63057 RepID=A0A2P5BTI3_TREOI|nr:hypothetical protein TorRG33x02_309390 [Trema orientale]